MNSYKLEADDAAEVVDKLVNADLIAATSTEELATAFQYSASFASAAGVSFDKMVGMLTTASETTRLSAETVGQAFKSMFSRLQNVKAGKSIDDEGEAINDSEKVLKRYNITLRDSATEFRDMEDVLDEVGRRWKEFDSVEQAQIATAISGVHQRNTFIAVMDNYDKVLKYTNETMNASGTSAQKYTHYMSSLEAKINELTVQWEQFIQGLNQSGTIKIGVSLLSGLLSVLDALTNKAPILQNVVGNILLFKGLKNIIPSVLSFKKNITGLIKTFVGLKASNPFTAFKELDSVLALSGESLSRYQKYQIMLITSSKKLTLEKKKELLVQQGLTVTQAESVLGITSLNAVLEANNIVLNENQIAKTQAILTDKNLSSGIKVVQIAEILLGNATAETTMQERAAAIEQAKLIVSNYSLAGSGAAAASAMTALNIALGAISLITMGAVTAVMAHNQAVEEARDKAKEAANTYKEQSENIDELIESYKELYKTLQNATDQSDVTSTQEELLSLQEQIVDTYGAQAKGIDLVNGNLDVQLQKIRELQRETAKEYLENPENKVEEAIDYMDKTSKRIVGFEGYTMYGQTDTKQTIKETLNSLFGDNVIVGTERGTGKFHTSFDFGELTDNEYIDTLRESIDKLNTAIDESDNPKAIDYYKKLRDQLYQTMNVVQNTDEYKTYSEIVSDLPNKIATASESFKSDLTGEMVDPQKLLDSYSKRAELVEQLALSENDKIVDTITGQEVTFDELYALMAEDSENLEQYINTLSGEEKETMKKYVQDLRNIFTENKDLIYLKEYLKGETEELPDWITITADDLLSDEEINKLKKKSPDILKAIISGETTDEEITPIIQKIQNAMEGVEYTTEDLINVLTALGYTYKETEKITAAGLIEGFSTDESEIKTITENIEKLNNAVKAVASGGVLDLEDLSDLRDADIDVSALVEGGIDNIAEISKLRDDYIQSVIDGLDEQIKINNEVMKQDKDMTEEEKRQIEFENKMIELRKRAIQSATEGIKTTANEYITALKSANEIMAQAQAYGDSTISEDILSSMVEQYADMAGYVEKYRLGLIDNDELLNAFKEFYQNDISNYQDYQKEKYINTTEYFEKWKKVNSDWVEEFKEKYGIDLNNYSTYIEAKAAIENKYKKIKEIEAKGYDFSAYVDEEGNYTEAGKKFLAEGVTDSVTRDMAAVLKTYQSAKKGLNEEINALTTEYTKTSEDVVIDTTFDMTEEIEARITTITNRMQGAYSLLHELQSSSSKLTIENLDAMKSAYPAMSQYIDQYLRKEMSRAELLSKFEEMYEQDKINYKNAQIEKTNYSEVAYSEFIKKNDDWVDEFEKDYQIDLENFATFAAAKEAILNGMSKYIDINTGEFTDAGKYFINNVNSADDAIFAGAMYKVQHAFKKFAEKTSEFSEDVADDIADGITDAIEDAVYSIEDALSDVSTILSGQVDYWEQITNGIVAAAQLEIDALDKEIDLLEKKNEEQRRQIELQEKLEALNRAKTQRNVREYNAETGQFEWTTNKKNIETAQREYDEALQEDEIKSKEAAKEWYEKYGESFSNVSSTIETQRQINQALQLLASMRGVDVNTLSYKDLLNMTDEEQAAIRSKYGSAVDTNLAFEDAQNQQNINKAKTNLVTGGYATNGKTGFAFNWEAITSALGSSITTLASTLDKYTEILKPTSFAETKPTANAVTNITNTGEVKNSYTFTGDMEFKFDKDVDADNFISKFVSKLQMQNGITTVK